jgi:hypothetical protein
MNFCGVDMLRGIRIIEKMAHQWCVSLKMALAGQSRKMPGLTEELS